MSSIKNVAIIGGAGGNLGPAVTSALLDAGFNVTVLSRSSSSSSAPAGAKVHKTDYASSSSLEEAFKGQHAVVSTIATAAVGSQDIIVNAAVKAGVKRFIPSEFGINTQKVTGGAAKILARKIETQKLLNEAVKNNPDFSWTGVATSLFFDWGLKAGSLGFNLKEKKATIYESGNEPFTGTNLHTIGLAIASILQKPEDTANKYFDIASFTTSQNEVLKILEDVSGEKWTVEKADTKSIGKSADESLTKGEYGPAFGGFLKVLLFGDGEGTSPKEGELANGLLGLPKEDLRGTIKGVLRA